MKPFSPALLLEAIRAGSGAPERALERRAVIPGRAGSTIGPRSSGEKSSGGGGTRPSCLSSQSAGIVSIAVIIVDMCGV